MHCTMTTTTMTLNYMFAVIVIHFWISHSGLAVEEVFSPPISSSEEPDEYYDDDESTHVSSWRPVHLENRLPRPLLRQTGNVTVIQNKGIRLYLICRAEYPTEWVYSAEDVLYEQLQAASFSPSPSPSPHGSGSGSGYYENEYHFVPMPTLTSKQRQDRTRWIASDSASKGEGNGTFTARLKLNYDHGLSSAVVFLCRAVSSHSNSKVIKFDPNVTATVTDVGEVHVTITTLNEPSQGLPQSSNSSDCLITFRIARTPSGYFWNCQGHGNAARGFLGVISFHPCPASSYCANTYRRFRVAPSCVSWVGPGDGMTTARISHDLRWVPMPKLGGAGVVSCVNNDYVAAYLGEPAREITGAVEYFYARGSGTGGSPSTLHTSMYEVAMVDLVWFDPPIASHTVFYTPESQKVSCFVSKYGFADYRRLLIRLNESSEPVLDWERDGTRDGTPNFEESSSGVGVGVGVDAWRSTEFVLHFEEYGPGEYSVDCAAHVWNTTEMVHQSRSLEVRRVLAPWFESEFENVTWDEGERDVRLDCGARGDPEPRVSCEHAYGSSHGHGYLGSLRIEGRELVVAEVSAAAHNGLRFTCTASNKFQDSATKEFYVQVRGRKGAASGPEVDSKIENETPMPTAGIVLLVLGLLVITALAAGLVFLYVRFVRFGRAVTNILTDEDVKEFLEGRRRAVAPPIDVEVDLLGSSPDYTPLNWMNKDQLTLDIDSLPYNSDYEKKKGDFSIDINKELGSGHYGVVYMGHMLGDGDIPVPVAIKTVRPQVPIEYFKALLSELKILAYIGSHEHVAKLVMAYTAEIKSRVLYVGVELCKCSLLQHLRTGNGGAVTSAPSGHEYQNQQQRNECELVRWAAEIASGMEFLTQKRVVHGDLAARNVLLSFDLRAKIGDFGLARQLVDYSYIKSQACNLPWKWMAPESLSKMHFSTKSDVWAYGVTCWELFSLGSVPYPATAWTWDFVDQLLNGKRLSRPAQATRLIYAKMQECWREQPADRPNFTQLAQFFREQERMASEQADDAVGSSAKAYANV